MASKRRRHQKRKFRIRFKQRARIIEKNDATRVAHRVDTIPKMNAQMPRTVAPVFRIKIKKK